MRLSRKQWIQLLRYSEVHSMLARKLYVTAHHNFPWRNQKFYTLPLVYVYVFSTGGRTRTHDSWFWRPELYQLSYTRILLLLIRIKESRK